MLDGHTVLVIGDVCLDDYHIGRAARLSREAPVPVLEFEERRQIAGAAANPAANVTALGNRAILLSLIGDDEAGVSLRRALEQAGIDSQGLIVEAGRPTSVKMRVMARGELHLPQQLARIDRVERQPLSPASEAALGERLQALAPQVNAILFSDYHAGLVTPALTALARQGAPHALLTADSQGDLDKYTGFALVKCNQAEAEHYLGYLLTTEAEIQNAIQAIISRLGLGAMLLTRGANGLSLGTQFGEYLHLPAANRSEVFDVTGAGDTVIAVATVALAGGASPYTAATLANRAAGIVVRKLGNATVTVEEIGDRRSEVGEDSAHR